MKKQIYGDLDKLHHNFIFEFEISFKYIKINYFDIVIVLSVIRNY